MIKILLVEDVKLDAELTEQELKNSGIDFISKRVEKNLILGLNLKISNQT